MGRLFSFWDSRRISDIQTTAVATSKTVQHVVMTNGLGATTSATTTETLVPTSPSNLMIPADTLISGRTLRISIKGTYTTGATLSSITARLKLGGVLIAASTITVADAAATSDWEATVFLQCVTGGVSGSLFSRATTKYLRPGTPTPLELPGSVSGITLNTTVPQALTLTVEAGSTISGTSVRADIVDVEILGMP